MRRLTNQATYLYVDNSDRYWIDTQPNVTRTACDRASGVREVQTWDEIIKRLKQYRQRGDFAGVHVAPTSSTDVPDEPTMGVRLVVLSPNLTHSSKAKTSEAKTQAQQILDTKGSAPRYCKNLLVFLAPDGSKKENLFQWVNQYLAWQSIVEEKEILNLNPFQNKQATAKLEDADETVTMLLQDTCQWLLVPSLSEDNPTGEMEWEEYRLSDKDSPILPSR